MDDGYGKGTEIFQNWIYGYGNVDRWFSKKNRTGTGKVKIFSKTDFMYGKSDGKRTEISAFQKW